MILYNDTTALESSQVYKLKHKVHKKCIKNIESVVFTLLKLVAP